MNLSTFLLNGVIFTVAMPVFAIGAMHLLRGYTRAKAALLFGSLVAIALWPLLVSGANALRIGKVEVKKGTWAAPAVPTVEPAQVSSGLSTSANVAQPAPASEAPPLPLVLAWLWGAGTGIALVGTLLDHYRSRVLLKRSVNLTGGDAELVGSALNRQGLSYPVRISSQIDAPAAVGHRGGVILLPQGPLPKDPASIDAILLHESAHLRGRHHLLLWVQSVAIAAAWWNPLVRIASRHGEEALEEICDESTVRQQSTGEPLARMLVAFSQKSVRPLRRPMLTMFRPGERLERRVRRLLSTGDLVMKNNSRIAATSAAVLLLASLSLAAAFTARVTSNLDDNSFGLKVGTEWTYQSSGGETIRKTVMDMREVKGTPVAEIKVSTKNYEVFEYLGKRSDGLWRYQASYLNHWPGLNSDWPAALAFKSGRKKGDTWSWSEIVPVQTGGNYKFDPNDFRQNTIAVVEAVDQTLKTPAGTFNVTVVKYDSRGKKLPSHSYRRWFSEEAGLVKQESLLPNQPDSLELIAFHPAGSGK